MASINMSEEALANSIITHQKQGVTALSTLITESSSDALRRDAINILDSAFTHQKRVFDYMTQNGWYQVQSASQQELNNAMNTVQQANV